MAHVPYLGVIDDDAVQGSNGKHHSVRQLEGLLRLIVRQTLVLRSQAEQLGAESNGHDSLKDHITALRLGPSALKTVDCCCSETGIELYC